MLFGDAIYREFDQMTSGQRLDEVALFRSLQTVFEQVHTSYPFLVSSVIHGAKSMVKFQVQAEFVNGYQGSEAQRELSDMMFIVVSPKTNTARLTFLQNKYLPPKHGKALWPCPFSGDLLQLDLLKMRPDFRLKGRDYAILKEAALPSIGAYGIFHTTSVAPMKYDMKYFSAHTLAPRQKSGVHIRRQIRFVEALENQISYHNGFQQIDSCSNMALFAESLLRLQIGAPFSIGNVIRALGAPEIGQGILDLVRQSDVHLDLEYVLDDLEQRAVRAEAVVILNADMLTAAYPDGSS